MKKLCFSVLSVILVLSLCGCCLCTMPVEDTPGIPEPLPTETSPWLPEPTLPETIPATEPLPETIPATEPLPETIPPTEPLPEHSELYIPGLSVEDVIRYFNEVCLDAEYSTGTGNPRVIQKWTVPIRYRLYGQYTQDDLYVLQSFAQILNAVEGFPGIMEAAANEIENTSIFFCEQAELVERMGANFYNADGGVTFWYRDNQIYEALVCCRSDLSQFTRNSVILEELYNGLGPAQDTQLRPDSISYAGFSEPQGMTQVDLLMLKLLYHPSMECGMDIAACEAVIRSLYY